jgi:hypothetical protein
LHRLRQQYWQSYAEDHEGGHFQYELDAQEEAPKIVEWAAEIQRLKDEHRETIDPARLAAAEVLALERKLSDLVNAAYGLTPEEVQLMWDTAPPRMPFAQC